MNTIERVKFGEIFGRQIDLFILKNSFITLKITNFGGIVTSLSVPDRNAEMDDIVLGFDHLEPYREEHPYFGCIVGRYANRIAGARFADERKTHLLTANAGRHHLHGGKEGFDKKIWDAELFSNEDESGIRLSYLSPDGEEGYPGDLRVNVVYSIGNTSEFQIRYAAICTKPTPVNLTHHGYFNLKGAGNGNILDHLVKIDADHYTPVNEELIPTGELTPVAGTALDFRSFKAVRQDMADHPAGFDHNFVLREGRGLRKAAEVADPLSGRTMEVLTDQPAMQLYTANFSGGPIQGKSGRKYGKHSGLCFETQQFPDAPNQPGFPDAILRPGTELTSTTVFRFGII